MFMEKALLIAHKIVKPLAAHMPVDRVFGLPLPTLLAITVIVLFCLLAGLFARTVVARGIVAGLEATVLAKVPGYEFIKSMRESMPGIESPETFPVVLVRFDDTSRIGFRVEEIEDGRVAVCVPDALDAKSGAIHFMSADRIRATDVRMAATMKCLKRFGVGSAGLLGGVFKGVGAAG